MKKAITMALSGFLLGCLLVACGGAQAAVNNQFVSNDPYTGVAKVYTVENVRMITATPSSFTLQYVDGNSSEAFPDTNYATLTKLLNFAPALKPFKRVGNSGTYINLDLTRRVHCQWGTATPAEASNTGDHLFVYWNPPGFLLIADPGCATFNAIKANSN